MLIDLNKFYYKLYCETEENKPGYFFGKYYSDLNDHQKKYYNIASNIHLSYLIKNELKNILAK